MLALHSASLLDAVVREPKLAASQPGIVSSLTSVRDALDGGSPHGVVVVSQLPEPIGDALADSLRC